MLILKKKIEFITIPVCARISFRSFCWWPLFFRHNWSLSRTLRCSAALQSSDDRNIHNRNLNCIWKNENYTVYIHSIMWIDTLYKLIGFKSKLSARMRSIWFTFTQLLLYSFIIKIVLFAWHAYNHKNSLDTLEVLH